MDRRRTANRTRLRGAAAALGLAGGAWGVLAVLGSPVLAIGVVAAAGGLTVLRYPAAGGALLWAASLAGPLLAGADWIGPAALQVAGATLALWATHDPFAEEVRRERELRGRTRAHGRPG